MQDKERGRGSEMILEINLISAQGLKLPCSKHRMQTYAMAWVNSSTKLRTRLDRVTADNPIWNDKFLFKVTPDFLASETSAVSVEIYASGYLVDSLIGTVRFLISNSPLSLSADMKAPCFTALQIRRPSGRFHGVLNIGAMLINGGDALNKPPRLKKSKSEIEFAGSPESDGGGSTTSSSSTASGMRSASEGMLCGLLTEMKILSRTSHL